MVNHSVVFHGPLMLGDAIPTTTNATAFSPLQKLGARVYIDDDRVIDGVSTMPMEGTLIHWSQDLQDLLLENSLCSVHGHFISYNATDSNGTDAEWKVTSFLCFPFPGNPDDEEYLSKLPNPQPAVLQGTGICVKTFPITRPDDTHLRSFELKTTVYDRSNKDNHSATFSIRCYFPTRGRFTATPLPDRNAIVAVCGEIVGTHIESGTVAILLSDMTFLSPRNTMTRGSDTSPTGSPGKKRAWEAWGSRSSRNNRPRISGPSSSPVQTTSSSQDTINDDIGE
ncbi:hypothetical protein BZA77DRAFT_27294 [Pyronema omphalodes]|nr:hypothetical protein BZA77DRAFT_26856 [Pyronema omphalodes]KAI5817841.1 hypothetical protein BZA77DRAFT_27294 [Pyronema omphalodes]